MLLNLFLVASNSNYKYRCPRNVISLNLLIELLARVDIFFNLLLIIFVYPATNKIEQNCYMACKSIGNTPFVFIFSTIPQ